MSFDWQTATTGVFYRAGRLLKAINSYNTLEVTTLPADLKNIVDPYEAADLTAIIATIYDFYQQQGQQAIVQLRQGLAGFFDQTLQDPVTVLQPLALLSNDVQTIIAAIIEQAIIDAQTFQRSTVTVGSVVAPTTPANKGNGVALVTKVLDGYNAPIFGGNANLNYRGLNSELAVPSETMLVQVVGDSMSNGLSEGAEQWQWTGGPAYQPFDWNTEGSGAGPGVTSAEGVSLLTDGNFENWTDSATPTNWTVDAGAARISQESSTIYRGLYALKFAGDGSTATIQVGQSVSPSNLTNRRRYCVPLWVRCSSVPASGTFIAKFTGTGYSAASVTPEVQTLQISGTPAGGTFTISWVGPYGGTQTTAAIAYNATAAQIQAALRLLRGLESVVVANTAGAPPDQTVSITFHGVPGDVNQITADITGLTGGSPAKAIATTVPGVEGEQINLPAAAFPVANTWVLRWFWVNLPDIIPSDWKLTIATTGTLSNAVNVFVDSVDFSPAAYHGGVGLVIVPGSTRFLNGDRLTFTLANSEGVFQQFARRWYKSQLPSAGSPTISDSLAS